MMIEADVFGGGGGGIAPIDIQYCHNLALTQNSLTDLNVPVDDVHVVMAFVANSSYLSYDIAWVIRLVNGTPTYDYVKSGYSENEFTIDVSGSTLKVKQNWASNTGPFWITVY